MCHLSKKITWPTYLKRTVITVTLDARSSISNDCTKFLRKRAKVDICLFIPFLILILIYVGSEECEGKTPVTYGIPKSTFNPQADFGESGATSSTSDEARHLSFVKKNQLQTDLTLT